MLETIIILFAFWGLRMILAESSLLATTRAKLFSHENLGPFFIQLFSCSLCLGTHVGAFIYLLYCLSHGSEFLFSSMVLWAFASGAINFLMEIITQKLTWGE
jgi:hypothetical protein